MCHAWLKQAAGEKCIWAYEQLKHYASAHLLFAIFSILTDDCLIITFLFIYWLTSNFKMAKISFTNQQVVYSDCFPRPTSSQNCPKCWIYVQNELLLSLVTLQLGHIWDLCWQQTKNINCNNWHLLVSCWSSNQLIIPALHSSPASQPNHSVWEEQSPKSKHLFCIFISQYQTLYLLCCQHWGQ